MKYFLVLLLLPASWSLQAQSKAGEIAPDAVRLEVDEMRPFFGKFAVVIRGQAQALINDKGEFVCPFGKYVYHNQITVYHPWAGQYGSAARNSEADKVIIITEVATGKPGFIDGKGQTHFPLAGLYEWGGNMDNDGFYRTGSEKIIYKHYRGQRIVYRSPNVTKGELGYTIFTPLIDQQWSNGLMPAEDVTRYNKAPFAQSKLIHESRKIIAKIGYIDRSGKFRISAKYDEAAEFSEGLAWVGQRDELKNVTWGAIDTTGKLVIPYSFRAKPEPFNNGRALVYILNEKGYRFGYVNRQGKLVFRIPDFIGDTTAIMNLPARDQYNPNVSTYPANRPMFFSEGYRWVSIGFTPDVSKQHRENYVHLLDTNGRYIPVYKKLLDNLASYPIQLTSGLSIYSLVKDEHFVFDANNSERNGTGMANIAGEVIIAPVFSKLHLFERESALQYAVVSKDEGWDTPVKTGYIDKTGVFRIIKVMKPE